METRRPAAITVSTEEREVLVELLEHELRNLPVEIHHTRTLKFRDQLKHRLALIEDMASRLKANADK